MNRTVDIDYNDGI